VTGRCWCAGPCLCRRAEDAIDLRPWQDDDGEPLYVPDAEREAS
jgi:hypothetical protein